jgi:6-phosphogluconate dehydrogenase
MKKQIGLIGLGKMGNGLALNMKDHGWDVIAYNRTHSKVDEIKLSGIQGAYSVMELVDKLAKPRIVWTMLTAGAPTQEIIFGENGLIKYLEEGDIIIEGGNSKFSDDEINAQKLKEKGIKYIDVGVSGGPAGARNGACLMIGGEQEIFDYLEPLFKDIAQNQNAYKFFPGYGAGHFVKMVHNGIEYGMMQSIAEGFNLMMKSDYELNPIDIADIYSKGSVIESRLISWTKEGFEKYGLNLKDISGSVASNGEGLWTVEAAKAIGEEAKIIEGSVQFRLDSQNKPSFTGQILQMIRNMFGGHSVN